MEPLTSREREILRLLAQDITVGEAAIVLRRNPDSMRMAVHRLRLKMQVRTTHGLLLVAERLGLLEKLPSARQ